MYWIPECLQRAVIVERTGPPSGQLETLQKIEFFRGGISAKGRIFEKLRKARLNLGNGFVFFSHKLDSLEVAGPGEPPVQADFDREGLEINVPGFYQRLDERGAAFHRHLKNIGIQELENHHAHLRIAELGQPGYQHEPFLAVQFFFGKSLGHVEQLLSDQALEFSKRLLLKDSSYLCSFPGFAFAQHQLSKSFEQRLRRIGDFFLQLLAALESRQPGELTARKLEELSDLIVDICPIGRWRSLFPGQ